MEAIDSSINRTFINNCNCPFEYCLLPVTLLLKILIHLTFHYQPLGGIFEHACFTEREIDPSQT